MTDLERLIENYRLEIIALMALLEARKITADEWEDRFLILVAVFAQAAMMLGAGRGSLTLEEQAYATTFVMGQAGYLSNFKLVVQASDEFVNGWNARAVMYSRAVKQTYWKGFTGTLPLPAMPAQGTLCRTNCGCEWEPIPINADAGDFDCYWRRGKMDSCDTCLEREAQWSPVRIRGWVLQ